MKKILVGIMLFVVIGVVFFMVKKNGNEYSTISWNGDGNFRTYISRDNMLLIGNFEQQKIVARISLEEMRAVLEDGNNKERYESRDIIVNPHRSEVYLLFNDKSEIGGPYVAASIHVIASNFDGSKIKDIAVLEGYDMPHVALSEDGFVLHVEQLKKQGTSSKDVILEKFDLNLADLQK